MKKLEKRKAFALLTVIVFIAVTGIVFITFYSLIRSSQTIWFNTYKKMQAMNYAAEGIELFMWYTLTESWKNRTTYWEEKISPLDGIYNIWFSEGDYTISEGEEVIYQDEPVVAEHIRTLTIESISDDEKEIVSSVDYGWLYTISFQATIINR